MEKPKFVYVTHINTTPEKLWEALTTPDFTQQFWGGRRIQSDWKVGSPVSLAKPDGTIEIKGEVLICEPPKVLAYTFNVGLPEGMPPEKPSRVTFEISVSYGVVKLTVTHDEFEAGSQGYRMISQGWTAILSSLKSLLETGKPLPFTWKG